MEESDYFHQYFLIIAFLSLYFLSLHFCHCTFYRSFLSLYFHREYAPPFEVGRNDAGPHSCKRQILGASPRKNHEPLSVALHPLLKGRAQRVSSLIILSLIVATPA